MNQLELFAGIGGISLAAEWAGIETVAFCEKEPFAQKVLRHRFPGCPIYDDVFKLTREVLEHDGIIDEERGIDIVSGGFPCQPFSLSGKRTGTADDRYLWPEMCRIIGEIRPTWVLVENVDGLVNMAQSDWDIVMEDEATICEETEMVLETIRGDLETIKYQSVPIIIPACGVGATHRRYRVFILGHTECSRRSRESWRRTGEKFADGHLELEGIRNDKGAAQSRLGRGTYELSDWLDGWGMNPIDSLINFISTYRQPAMNGISQFSWEPSRVTKRGEMRSNRLKALGNAVNPLTVLPILYGIRILHQHLYG
jgi:DNA (cytosine-5)-methyltransferase 1